MRKRIRQLASLFLLTSIAIGSAGCPWWRDDDRGGHEEHHDDHHDEHHDDHR